MKCSRFQESLSEYLDGQLAAREAGRFAEHALKCRSCRAEMDDVKGVLRECKEQSLDLAVEVPASLESALIMISADYADLDCCGFEELITEFLDGFVPALTYQRFEAHATCCDRCSDLLTDVVFAVAGCHSVHTYEEVQVPAALVERLAGLAARPEQRRRLTSALVRDLTRALFPSPLRWAPSRVLTAAGLALATFTFFLIGFSDDRSVAGIYRQVHVKSAEFFSQSEDLYSQTGDVVAGVQRVGSDIGEIWDTIGGVDSSDAGYAERSEGNSGNVKRPAPPRTR